jgi:hypothetical protein
VRTVGYPVAPRFREDLEREGGQRQTAVLQQAGVDLGLSIAAVREVVVAMNVDGHRPILSVEDRQTYATTLLRPVKS